MLLMCNEHGAVSGNTNINVALSLDCSITIQFYVLIFLPVVACFCQLLPVFTTVLTKILFAMARTQPWNFPVNLFWLLGSG